MEQITFTVIVAIVVGLTEMFKRVFPTLKRFAPLLSLIFGVILCIGAYPIPASIYLGAIVGLTASGLWSGGKHFMKP